MGLLARGMSRLARVQAENESETVTISRPSGFTNKSVAAVIAGPGFGQQANADIPGRIGDWAVDFVIRVSDWEAAGCTGEPKEGDVITRSLTRGGPVVSNQFRVAIDSNIPAWDWGEPERLTYRIHARYEGAT